MFQAFLGYVKVLEGVPGFLEGVPGCSGFSRRCSGVFRVFLTVPGVPGCSGVPVFRYSWNYYMPRRAIFEPRVAWAALPLPARISHSLSRRSSGRDFRAKERLLAV